MLVMIIVSIVWQIYTFFTLISIIAGCFYRSHANDFFIDQKEYFISKFYRDTSLPYVQFSI